MLVAFYQEMKAHALWEMAAVCGSQIVLIGFNVVLLTLSIANWRKRAGKSAAVPVATPAAAPGKAAAKARGTAVQRNVIKAQVATAM